MRLRLAHVLSVSLLGAMVACTPGLNWRVLAIGETSLSAMFPCKPDTVIRKLPIGPDARDMAMRSCDADGVTFAVAHANLADPSQAPAMLAAWRASTLAGLRAQPDTVSSLPPPGLPALPQQQVLRAGRAAGPGGPALQLIGVWFARGADVFAAFVMAPAIPQEAAETFFAGLQLR
jgi:hypothetical protein